MLEMLEALTIEQVLLCGGVIVLAIYVLKKLKKKFKRKIRRLKNKAIRKSKKIIKFIALRFLV